MLNGYREDTQVFFSGRTTKRGGGKTPLTTNQKSLHFTQNNIKEKVDEKKYEPLRFKGGGGSQTLVVRALRKSSSSIL